MSPKKPNRFTSLFAKLRRREQPTLRVDERAFLMESENLLTGLWRSFRIWFELMRGFYAFRDAKNCITIFGSSRFKPGDFYYEAARKMARKIIESNFNVMTGGGPGIMEAGIIGAIEAGGDPYACAINVPEFGGFNPHVTRGVLMKYFFVRKMMLTKYSVAFIGMPGGFGTLDEVFEIATLIQTGKLKNFPVVLFGKEYWQPLMDFIRHRLIINHTISDHDIDIIYVTDSVDDAMTHIKKTLEKVNGNK